MKKFALPLLVLLLACALGMSGCGKASPATPCGRYCLTCGQCANEAEGVTKTVLKILCAFEGTKACEEICNNADQVVAQVNNVVPPEYKFESLSVKPTVVAVETKMKELCAANNPWEPLGDKDAAAIESTAGTDAETDAGTDAAAKLIEDTGAAAESTGAAASGQQKKAAPFGAAFLSMNRGCYLKMPFTTFSPYLRN